MCFQDFFRKGSTQILINVCLVYMKANKTCPIEIPASWETWGNFGEVDDIHFLFYNVQD